VSHDLRTPLAGVKAAISTLRARDVVLDVETQQELLAGAEDDVDRLTTLVADLLDLSRLEAGALSVFPKPVALEDIVPRALDYAAVGRQVKIELPPELPMVAADPVLLERVLANLVQNALRYSPDDVPVVSGSHHGDWVEVRVVDRGPGIPVADRERVFTPFQRLGDSTNHFGPGVGLGLAVSRGFAEAMGGTLTPEDTPGGGLTMVVSLPAAQLTLPAAPMNEPTPEPTALEGSASQGAT
jgi:two-component system sensor histidine kinase KdpD